MASRRWLRALNRHSSAILTISPSSSLNYLETSPLPAFQTVEIFSSKFPCILTNTERSRCSHWSQFRTFSSNGRDDDEDEDSEEDGEEEEDYESGEDEGVSRGSMREYTAEEKEAEAAAIGYKVIGPLSESDQPFKPYEPVFAVVQIGSHQFKVSNGDSIFTERLKFCDVNDKLILNKVLLLGSNSQTIVGRPNVPDAAVHAVVEEHALDAKVLIFKKKRRKNYRRTKGHRQELTKLRITDIQGIAKPESTVDEKPLKPASRKKEKVAVAA